MLSDKYAMAETADDLKAAILKAEEAVASTPLNHSNQAMYLNSLGSMLSYRYTRTGNVDDERTAVHIFI
ncbi:hypothetical protein K458DRAFT_130773 [Lentithecium fluviatile CBS 122367]|uniref:Uncharacterized protein n=1 Tax=Lentithecium fluviatile CBS 122367 TaxID=1168545 RepID=A0A6G1JHQ6_9PLEO|nr:hypothetical protein K458DRAFT_130773 [Lentithecium fluviatile CBS 122367]